MLWLTFVLLLLAVNLGPAAAASTDKLRSVAAARLTGKIVLDGRMTEVDWRQAPVSGEFWQREPEEGATPSQATEFRVLYDDNALYIGVRAHDTNPDKIRGLLTRRDEDSSSDWIMIGVDSYHDKRTSFSFGINPAGVQRDFLIYDDVAEDGSWDAVWEAATKVDEDGWVAEFRIPYSQLRFSAESEQRWGIQVARVIQRTGETTTWAPMPRSKQQRVSLYGEVQGIRGIHPPRRIELMPYALGGLRAADVDAANPYQDSVDPQLSVGVDFNYGITTNLTLSGTINPDFGQVEVDPSQVNLSANETFLAERRPFFVEGRDIFKFGLSQGDGVVEQLFYSRRIGAPPSLTAEGVYVDQDPMTNILGATKLSGKTRSGWAIGVLTAVTGKETARFMDVAGDEHSQVVEPLTNYSVLRLRKDLNGGRTNIGVAGTGVHRSLSGTKLGFLHTRGYAAGLQLGHRSADGNWVGDAKLTASSVHGSKEALRQTQQASQRYFQRPDATHLQFDPDRTSLAGMGLMASLSNIGHAHWRGAIGLDSRTPGMEVNDLGFQRKADYVVNWLWLQYRDDNPGDTLRQLHVNTNLWGSTDWAPNLTSLGGNVNGRVTFLNRWGLAGGANLNFDRLNTEQLRGGPAVAGLPSYGVHASMSSDNRQRVQGHLSSNWWHQPESRSWAVGSNVGISLQARSNLDVGIAAFARRRADDSQYIGEFVDAVDGPRYLLGRINQTTLGLTIRANYTLSPRLSLQLYAQPFVASGRYSHYKEPDQVRADDYDDRFHEFEDSEVTLRADGTRDVDLDRDGVIDYRFERADFNFRELKSTVVLRWEYLPGSTLFAIWSHNRDGSDQDGVGLGTSAGRLTDVTGEHVALLKLSYRWSAQ